MNHAWIKIALYETMRPLFTSKRKRKKIVFRALRSSVKLKWKWRNLLKVIHRPWIQIFALTPRLESVSVCILLAHIE